MGLLIYCFRMIPVLKNRPEYQIQMQQDGPYPFTGPKPDKFITSVRLTIPFTQSSSHQSNHESIKRIINLENECIIKINKVTESHLKRSYTVVYQYVPFRLNCPCGEFQEYIKSGKYKPVLYEMFKEMLENGVKPVVKMENFGFDADFRIKMFVRPNSEVCSVDYNVIEKMANGFVAECERVFVNREINEKFKSKVTNLSQKLKRIQNQILTKDLRRKQKKSSQSGMNSSENSDSLAKTGSNQKIGNAQWQFDHDFYFQDSYSVRDSKNKKKKRSSSFKDGEKPKSETKQKKASWQGSWKQEKLSFIQSDKITVLKKRISEALLKTQKTLTKYEKIKSRGDRKKQANSSKIQ